MTILAYLCSLIEINKTFLWITTFLSAILAIFSPIAVMYHILVVALFVNWIAFFMQFISGKWKGRRLCRRTRNNLLWSAMINSLLRTFFYIIFISLIWLMERYIISEFIGSTTKSVTAFVTAMFMIVELSFIRNSAYYLTKEKVFNTIINDIKKILFK